MMEAAITSETSVNFYQTTRHDSPEDSHLHTPAMRILNPTYKTDVQLTLMKSIIRCFRIPMLFNKAISTV
jgi:hypothetical protein